MSSLRDPIHTPNLPDWVRQELSWLETVCSFRLELLGLKMGSCIDTSEYVTFMNLDHTGY